MGSPWEIVRNDVSYPVQFYGKVIFEPDGSKKWVGGENIVAVAYDVPIPGYKTKTTINLRLSSTKVAPEESDLGAFNAGDHAKAYAAIKNAEKVWNWDEFMFFSTVVLRFYHIYTSTNNLFIYITNM